MTLAVAYAVRKETTRGIWVLSDSRLTLESGYVDTYVKARPLSGHSTVIMAGSSLPVVFAADMAAPFIAATEETMLKGPMSLWTQAGLYVSFLFPAYRRLLVVNPNARSRSVVAGYLADGSPALIAFDLEPVQGRFAPSGLPEVAHTITLHRPMPGQPTALVIGDLNWIPILHEAVRRSRGKDNAAFHKIVSVLWDIMKHQGHARTKEELEQGTVDIHDPPVAETVGGGMLCGYSNDGEDFQWPLIEIEGRAFCRGFEFSDRPPHWPKPMHIDYDATLFAKIERASHEKPIDTNVSAQVAWVYMPGSLQIGTPHFWEHPEPDWAEVDRTGSVPLPAAVFLPMPAVPGTVDGTEE